MGYLVRFATDLVRFRLHFLNTGYQRELTYSHPDGSYSAFGSRDKSGSTWLTAFVVKSFVQAKPYIFIDDDVVIKAVNWLVSQQNPNGTFKEPGRVIHKEMQVCKMNEYGHIFLSTKMKTVDGTLLRT